MTKKELLKRYEECSYALKNESRLDSDFNEFKRKRKLLYDNYSLIKAALMFCPDDLSLDGISSIEGLQDKGALVRCIRENNFETICNRLNAILVELKTLANCYLSNDVEKLRETATVLAVRNEWLNNRQKRSHKIVYPLFIATFIILSILILAFAVIDACEVFDHNTIMAKICSGVITVAGALDAVNGVGFFIYERHDDKKKKNNQIDMNIAINNDSVAVARISFNSSKIKTGKNANFGIIASRDTTNADELLKDYVIKYDNSKIKSGDDANFGVKR